MAINQQRRIKEWLARKAPSWRCQFAGCYMQRIVRQLSCYDSGYSNCLLDDRQCAVDVNSWPWPMRQRL